VAGEQSGRASGRTGRAVGPGERPGRVAIETLLRHRVAAKVGGDERLGLRSGYGATRRWREPDKPNLSYGVTSCHWYKKSGRFAELTVKTFLKQLDSNIFSIAL